MGQHQSATNRQERLKQHSYYKYLSDRGKELFIQAIEDPGVFLDTRTSHEACASEGEVPPIEAFRLHEENKICADCTDESSSWASVTHGVFLCALCVGAHRSLGHDASFTQSTVLDSDCWTEDKVQKFMKMGGNNKVNERLEYFVPSGTFKPAFGISGDERRSYIFQKYVQEAFTKANTNAQTPQAPETWRPTTVVKHCVSATYGQVGYVGILNAVVLSANELSSPNHLHKAVAATSIVKSINPYVMLELGRHQAMTSVRKRTDSPVWNEGPDENMRLSMPWDGKDMLHISVWSREHLIKDGLLGKAILEICGISKFKACDYPDGVSVTIDLFRMKVKFPCTCKSTDSEDGDTPPTSPLPSPSAEGGKTGRFRAASTTLSTVSAATSRMKRALTPNENRKKCGRCRNVTLVPAGELLMNFSLTTFE